MKQTIKYYANGIDYKFELEDDGWWSIYEFNPITFKYIPVIQSKDLSHAKSFCVLREPIRVPVEKLC